MPSLLYVYGNFKYVYIVVRGSSHSQVSCCWTKSNKFVHDNDATLLKKISKPSGAESSLSSQKDIHIKTGSNRSRKNALYVSPTNPDKGRAHVSAQCAGKFPSLICFLLYMCLFFFISFKCYVTSYSDIYIYIFTIH